MSARRRAATTPAAAAAGQGAADAARWGQRLLLAGGILAFWPGLPEPYYGPKSLCCAAGVTLAWLALGRSRRAPLAAPVAVLLGVALVSTLRAADPGESFWGNALQPYYGLLQLLLYALAYWLGASADDALLEDGLSALAAAAIGCGLVAAAQAAGAVPEPWATMDGRELGPTGSPVFFGAVAAILLAPSLSAAARRGGWRNAAPAAVLLALGLARARGAWLAAAAATAAWLAFSGRLAGRARAAAWALAAVALAGTLLVAVPKKAASDVLRLETWRAAVEASRERPLLGYGPDGFLLAFRRHASDAFISAVRKSAQRQMSAHNDLLQAAATMGLAGLAAYLWLLAAAVVASGRAQAAGRGELGAAAAGGLVAAFVAAKFNPLPLEACAAAAWLAGALSPRGQTAGRWTWPALAAGSLGALACVLGAATSSLARVSAQQLLEAGRFSEGIDEARLARRLTPGKLSGVEALCQALATAAQNSPPSAARLWAAEGLAEGRRAALAHAGNPSAHELAGTMALVDAQVNGDLSLLDEARSQLVRASELDPHHTYPVQRRLEIARLLHDKDSEARESARLEQLRRVGGD